MNLSNYLATCFLSMALVACGGGGGDPGTPSGTAPNPSNTVTPPIAADFIFELDKTTILNTGSDKALLTVTTLDSNRNTLPKVPVVVAVDGNGILTGVSGASTDTLGKFSANIMMGGDKSDRTINASITVNGVTKVASVVVTGSQLSVTPIPAAPTPGQTVTLNLSAADSLGAPIQNVDLTLAGTAGASGTVKTDASGIQVATFSAPTTAGSYTVVVSGLGVLKTTSILVGAVGSIAEAIPITEITSKSLSPQPTSISTNISGSTTNRSKLSAKFLATGNAGIQYMRVRFEIVPPALGADESISTENATVYTDTSGTAEADYISGTRSSPTNGVLVRACYKSTDFLPPTVDPITSKLVYECPNFVSANLTVRGVPLSISITDDNKLSRGLGGIAYLKQFLIQVNDASGVAVKDAIVSASVDITHYGKGKLWASPYSGATKSVMINGVLTPVFTPVPIPTIRDIHDEIDPALDPTPLPTNYVRSLSASATAPLDGEKIWCINEDWNRNGFLDTGTGEDRNKDGVIQPRKAEVVVSYVSGNKTDANGQMLVQISYGQNMGGWLAYTLRATTSVAGSEGDASKSYVTNVIDADVSNGSFLTPPYGSGACNDAR